MATTTPTPTRSTQADGDQCVALRDIGWEGYTTMLRLRGDRAMPRMVYLDGDLLLMSPSFPHERLAFRLGVFVTEIVVGLDIPCVPARSTTFRRRKKRGGVEGDQTFYLAHEAQVRGKDKINLRVDPPPDLAIEAVHTHPVAEALEVYRRLRVPEVWVADEDGVRILVRQANGRYAEVPQSASFPFLTVAELTQWIMRPQAVSETDWVKEVRCWVRETLAPRLRRPEP